MKLLAVVIFENNEYGAGHALYQLDNLGTENLVDLQEAAIIKRRNDGKVELHQMVHFSMEGLWEGTYWANFVTLLCAGPLNWEVVDSKINSFSLLLTAEQHGIEFSFIKALREGIKPGSSALLLLVRSLNQDIFFDKLMNLKGKLHKTFFFKEIEVIEMLNIVQELSGNLFNQNLNRLGSYYQP